MRLTTPSSTTGRGREGLGHRLSHLIGRVEGRRAELADLPDVFPGHHPSPPGTPTYHSLSTGVQVQRWWALRFAAVGEKNKGEEANVRLTLLPLLKCRS